MVASILREEKFRANWKNEVEGMRSRLGRMRESLVRHLISRAKKIDFSYLETHKGMFSLIDINKNQVEKLRDQYGIYLLDNGRINVAGLTDLNIEYVANSLIAVCDS